MNKGTLYLSYFRQEMYAKGAKYSISIKTPIWVSMDGKLKGLYPSVTLRNNFKYNGLPWSVYCAEYLDMLKNNDSVNDLKLIQKSLDDGEDVTLFCWEATPPCHRFLVGAYFKFEGYNVKTFDCKTRSWRDLLNEDVMLGGNKNGNY